MPIGVAGAFLALDFLLVMTPGADWAFAISAGVRNQNVVASVAGLASGYVVHAALVAVGVGALLARDARALSVLTLAGAAYLLLLGATIARHPATVADDGAETRSPARAVLRGAAVSGLNPKGLLLFFAVLPQFVVSRAPWPVPCQLAVLGGFHVVACAAVYLAVAVCARRILRTRPQAGRIVSRTSGISMILIAIALIAERVASL